jgi:5-methylcytosine-specific restriction endonuclease McrA
MTDKKDCRHDEGGNFITGDKYPTIDHIAPISKGGTHTWDNVGLACKRCNSLKSNNTVFDTATGQMRFAV